MRIAVGIWVLASLACAPTDVAASPDASVVVADFDGAGWQETVEADGGATVAGAARGDGRALSIQVPAGADWARVVFDAVPADIRKYRTLRLWMRGSGEAVQDAYLRIYDASRRYLVHKVEAWPAEWTRVDIRLGALPRDPGFDPERIDSVRLVWFETKGETLAIDDVAFVEGEGGWELTDEEFRVLVFGEKRARKAKKRRTKHFDVWTDTRGALKKLPRELEATYESVRAMLALPEMENRLPVYVFQNPQLYWDFCERHLGWDQRAAQLSAGHGSARYFATYFQGNRTPTITHELTHAMFHRLVGWGGGSWYQEGVAVYCEARDSKKSVARDFSPHLRGERFVPLREFIATERLIDSEDTSGGARTSDTMYDQAGALFEFMLRSAWARAEHDGEQPVEPRAALAPALHERLVALATLREDGEARVAAVERIFGVSIEALQQAWVAWGSKPPKD